MKNAMLTFEKILMGFALVQILACAHEPEKASVTASGSGQPATPAAPTMEAKQLAAAEKAPYVVELRFGRGKVELSPMAQKELRKLLTEAGGAGRIEEIKAVTWADEEYPSVHTKKLNDTQRSLANSRGEAIQRFVANEGVASKVKLYNMAERPGMMAEFVSTSNARIKKALEVAGIPNTDSSIKTPAKASRSIVMVLLRND